MALKWLALTCPVYQFDSLSTRLTFGVIVGQLNGASGDHPREYSPEPSAVRAIPGYQAIVDHLRREISLGRIIPGDRLPAERKLAEQFGVARETLRQALRVLEGSGQIVIQRGAAGGPVVQGVFMDPDAMLRELRDRKTRSWSSSNSGLSSNR